MVYYQKYRPQSLDEIVGQASVKASLSSAFKDNRLSHAYLFCGPRGTGKTSTARILAKMINCQHPDKSPCNSCDSCKSITDGSNLDLIEIDAASNRGIDDIRTLRENIKLTPTSATKKVYIIDEVHMLSNEAFNALLKTLEEPPAHAIFILATTEEHKIPVTILSRVQKLDFQLGSVSDLMTALKRVVDGEKIKIDDDALRAVAKRAEGSFRDGTKILDQLAARGEKITVEIVDEVLNAGSFNGLLEMVEAMAAHDPAQALAHVNQLSERGLNLKDYFISLTELIRYLFLIKHGGEEYVKDNLGPARFAKLNQLAGQFSAERLIEMIKCLQQSIEKMKTTMMPILALEVAVVECCRVPDSAGTAAPAYQHSEDARRMPHLPSSTSSAGVRRDLAPAASPAGPIINIGELNVQEATITVSETQTGPTVHDDSYVLLQDKWTYVLETVKSMNYSLEALLRSVRLAGCEENVVSIEVPYSFHQRILEAPKNRDLIESVLSDVLSKSVKVVTVLGERPVQVEDLANIELAADDEIIRVAAEIFSSDPITPDPQPN